MSCDDIQDLTGYSKCYISTLKSKGEKIRGMENCYIIDDKTPIQQLRKWYTEITYEDEEWEYFTETRKISNYGRVIDTKYKKYPNGMFILPVYYVTSSRTAFTTLGDKEKTRVSISKLVAEKFLRNPLNLPRVRHKDYKPYNNYYKNLEYCTNSEVKRYSSEFATFSRMNNRIVIIDTKNNKIIDYGYNQKEIADILYTEQSAISRIINGHKNPKYKDIVIKYEKDLNPKERKLLRQATI